MSVPALVWLVAFLCLCTIGAPISVSVGLAAALALMYAGVPLASVSIIMYSGLDSFILTAIPFFLFIGTVMAKGDMAKRLFDFAEALIGWLPGGLGAANVVASLFFGGISGSSVADAAGLGQVEMAGMLEHGYSRDYSAAITVASSTLAVLIPPSIIMVVYAVSAGQSVARALLAGVGPGLVVALGLLIVNHLTALRHNWRPSIRFRLSNILVHLRKAFWALLTPVIVLGGIITGVATPTEAAVLGSVYALVVSLFIYRSLRLRDLPGLVIETGRVTGVTLLLISTASLTAYILVREGVPQTVAEFMSSIVRSRVVMLLMVHALLLIVGMFVDALPALVMLVPVLVPIFTQFGVDLIHAGTIVICTLAIGLITPPVGICLFAISRVAGIRIERVIRALLPFYVSVVASLLVVTFVPAVSLWIPNLVLGK